MQTFEKEMINKKEKEAEIVKIDVSKTKNICSIF
jgi:hypothetical protein